MYISDSETCPSCFLGPQEECDDWKGKCGEKLVCQYQTPYSSTGKCVSEKAFNSRKAGDSCGSWEGSCQDGLKCLIEPDSWTYFCGIEESGNCILMLIHKERSQKIELLPPSPKSVRTGSTPSPLVRANTPQISKNPKFFAHLKYPLSSLFANIRTGQPPSTADVFNRRTLRVYQNVL